MEEEKLRNKDRELLEVLGHVEGMTIIKKKICSIKTRVIRSAAQVWK